MMRIDLFPRTGGGGGDGGWRTARSRTTGDACPTEQTQTKESRKVHAFDSSLQPRAP